MFRGDTRYYRSLAVKMSKNGTIIALTIGGHSGMLPWPWCIAAGCSPANDATIDQVYFLIIFHFGWFFWEFIFFFYLPLHWPSRDYVDCTLFDFIMYLYNTLQFIFYIKLFFNNYTTCLKHSKSQYLFLYHNIQHKMCHIILYCLNLFGLVFLSNIIITIYVAYLYFHLSKYFVFVFKYPRNEKCNTAVPRTC